METLKRRGVKASNLLVAGHAVIDEVLDSPNHESRQSLGGALCYSCVCLKSLGHEADVVTHVGKDFPVKFRRFLRQFANVDIDEWYVNNSPTTRYLIDRREEERRLWLRAKCNDITKDDFRLAMDRLRSNSPKGLIVNPVAGEISLDLLKTVSKEFDHVFVDSQGFTRRFHRTTREVSMKDGLDISRLDGVDALKADMDELFAWTGSNNEKRAVKELSRFVQNVIVTSGSGLVELYVNGISTYRMKPLEVVVRDTTGAGDILVATLAAEYLAGKSMKDALRFAVIASSLAVQRVGIRKAILSRDAICKKL